MAARLLVGIGVMFGGLCFVGNILGVIESVSQGQSFVGAAVAALIGGALAAGGIWALSLERPDEARDPFGRARFAEDRKAAEKGGLE